MPTGIPEQVMPLNQIQNLHLCALDADLPYWIHEVTGRLFLSSLLVTSRASGLLAPADTGEWSRFCLPQ